MNMGTFVADQAECRCRRRCRSTSSYNEWNHKSLVERLWCLWYGDGLVWVPGHTVFSSVPALSVALRNIATAGTVVVAEYASTNPFPLIPISICVVARVRPQHRGTQNKRARVFDAYNVNCIHLFIVAAVAADAAAEEHKRPSHACIKVLYL